MSKYEDMTQQDIRWKIMTLEQEKVCAYQNYLNTYEEIQKEIFELKGYLKNTDEEEEEDEEDD